ncbi:MAG: transcriptional repressor [Chitinophagaceae bacterium]|nr:transcriptional repressor [Chitinophagaceae bacterium]
MNVSEHIREKGLKATPARMKVLEELTGTGQALSHTELESTFSKVDRITLYRVLKDFEEAGLVHKIIGPDGVTRFAVCRHNCPDETHTEDHVHFNCTNCHKVFCLEHTHNPDLRLPTGFKISGIQILVQGICKHCS